jgi:hypothetical protein
MGYLGLVGMTWGWLVAAVMGQVRGVVLSLEASLIMSVVSCILLGRALLGLSHLRRPVLLVRRLSSGVLAI